MRDFRNVIDLKHVTCGLVPAIIAELDKRAEDEVRVFVRRGIRDELWNSFGSGGQWEIEMRDGVFHDEIVFRRVANRELDPLKLMDF